MNTHLLALQLMAAQGCLGAFDTLYHHELTESLPQRATARRELAIHAVRAAIYGVLFIGLSAWRWQGAWAWALPALFGIEIVLTLWDFVVEDQTRLLPATERVTHTVLAINGGAFIGLLLLGMPESLAAPTGFQYAPQGWLSVFLAVCGAGVLASAVRDGLAARSRPDDAGDRVRFDGPPQTVLVTGATGFIGHSLLPALLASGHRVIVLSREPNKAAWEFGGAVRVVDGLDRLPPDENIDVVINLAGARILGWRWNERRKAVLRASRIGVTRDVVDWIAAAARKPRLLISASAIGYYGIQPQDSEMVLNEASPPQAVFMSQLCQEWEAAAARARENGVPVALARFGLVFGRGGALLGEQSALLLEGAAVAPTRLLASGFTFRYPTVRAALSDLA